MSLYSIFFTLTDQIRDCALRVHAAPRRHLLTIFKMCSMRCSIMYYVTVRPILLALPCVILGGFDRNFVPRYCSPGRSGTTPAAHLSFWAVQRDDTRGQWRAPLGCVLGGAARCRPSEAARPATPAGTRLGLCPATPFGCSRTRAPALGMLARGLVGRRL